MHRPRLAAVLVDEEVANRLLQIGAEAASSGIRPGEQPAGQDDRLEDSPGNARLE
jgi:hypothetical protein